MGMHEAAVLTAQYCWRKRRGERHDALRAYRRARGSMGGGVGRERDQEAMRRIIMAQRHVLAVSDWTRSSIYEYKFRKSGNAAKSTISRSSPHKHGSQSGESTRHSWLLYLLKCTCDVLSLHSIFGNLTQGSQIGDGLLRCICGFSCLQ